MTDILFYILVGLAASGLALQVFVILRKPSNQATPELLSRLANIEQTTQNLLFASAKSSGILESVVQQIKSFTELTMQSLEQSRQAIDEKLAQTVEESRNGRSEVLNAFQAFEGKLELRLGVVETTITTRLTEFQGSTSASLEASRQAIDEKLSQTVAESRTGRNDLVLAFQAFEAKVEQRLSGFDTSQTMRFEALQHVLAAGHEESSKALTAYLIQAQANAAAARKELTETLTTFRSELTSTLTALSAETIKSREAMSESATAFETRIQERFEALTTATRATLDSLKSDITGQLGITSNAMRDQLETNGNQIRNQFSALQESVAQQLGAMALGTQQNGEQLRTALNERLAAIQADNTAKLEEMRRTVDEKLHATLEQRLGDSFKLVSERLEQVHAGLGEMKTLAGSVGDLKRVMTNVRSRGTWGEVQLGAIIENILTAEQYAKNVKTVPGSNELVEFAIRMPGGGDEQPVWLPIDSKYPIEHYQRLIDAHDTMDKGLIQQMANSFESSIRTEAKKIASKYLSPPYTTDFAILFVPTEGLFAEALRVPGLVEALQNDYRVVITGPANLAAMLNSLRMGFRTLAIEKRSSDVWNILGSVKTEFRKFGEIVDATKKSIDAAANKFTDLGRRTRAIQRHLQDVQELPAIESPAVLLQDDAAVLNDDLNENSVVPLAGAA